MSYGKNIHLEHDRHCFAVLFTLQLPGRAETLPTLPQTAGAVASDPSALTLEPTVEAKWEPGATVEIAKIRSGILPGVLIGGHYEGLLKIRQQRYVATGQLDEQLENSVRYLLEDELSRAGLDVMGAHPQSVFEEWTEVSEPGRYLIGGTITHVNLNSYSSLFSEYTNDERSIRWELFDRGLNKVVYRQEIAGSGKAEGIDNPAATYEATRASFKRLLGEPGFIALLNRNSLQDTPTSVKPYKIEAIAAMSQPLTLEQLVGQTIPSIVQIHTSNGNGSGFCSTHPA